MKPDFSKYQLLYIKVNEQQTNKCNHEINFKLKDPVSINDLKLVFIEKWIESNCLENWEFRVYGKQIIAHFVSCLFSSKEEATYFKIKYNDFA